jgi:uncharacterized protein YdiU (UPF0061 family)
LVLHQAQHVISSIFVTSSVFARSCFLVFCIVPIVKPVSVKTYEKQAYGLPETMTLMTRPLFAFEAGFAELDNDFATPTFATPTLPTPLPDAHWVGCNDALRLSLGLPDNLWHQPEVLEVLTGKRVLPNSNPYASVYSGHQFGHWAGQLGDGRALNLGALKTADGLQEIQLKGAGPTPYSRQGDGRAVLRSSIREFLASEAMHGLHIPTTRALCVTGSVGKVRREEIETAAVVTRVAPSFVRFGHFEHFASSNNQEALRALADHVVQTQFQDLQELKGAERYTALLREITHRTAELMAHWQAVGFCHGVMNTDNMSVLGLTLDYGPFQFLDGFDVNHICNHSDTQGRYAFARQPQVAYWNLFCLGQALMPLIDDQALAIAALETYKQAFPNAFGQRMRDKLGLKLLDLPDLIDELLKLLNQDHVDYTVFWRRLSLAVLESGNLQHAFEPVRDLFMHREAFDAWCQLYLSQLGADRAKIGRAMLQSNPKYVLRNHLGELAIRQAKAGNFSMVQDLLLVLQSPFEEHPSYESWAGLAPEWASSIEISCSS